MIQKNTTLIYVLAIGSFLCCCVGGIGFIPAAIAYMMATKSNTAAIENPEQFIKPDAFKTAKIIALVALVVNILYLVYTIYQISTIGWDELMEQSRLKMEQMGVEQP